MWEEPKIEYNRNKLNLIFIAHITEAAKEEICLCTIKLWQNSVPSF